MDKPVYEELFRAKNYIEFLSILFLIKKRKNYRLSKRSYAKFLGISHSHLLNILSDKKKLSPSAAKKIADKCDFDVSLKVFFIDLVNFGEEYRTSYLLENNYNKILDTKSIFSYWYNPFLITLAGIENLKLTPEKAAEILGINSEDAREALLMLSAQTILKKNEYGFYTKNQNLGVTNKAKNKDIEIFYIQLMEKVKEKIVKTEVSKRSITSLSFAVNESQFRLMQEKLFNFRCCQISCVN